jgi:prevent-host-death family protein
VETMSAFNAKTHFSSLLARVAKGEEVTITKHGTPVAKLVPVQRPDPEQVGEVIRRFREIRKGMRLDGLSVRELIEEGRA